MSADRGDSADTGATLRSFLGLGSPPASLVGVDLVSSSFDAGFALEHLVLRTAESSIPALVGVPEGEGPFPSVAVFHQHAGKRHLGKSEVFGLVGDPLQAFGPAFVRRGCVVVAIDSVAFEDRRPAGPGTDVRPDDWDQHYNEMAYRLVSGDTLMRTVLEDSMAAITYLSGRPDVDPDRIGAVGHSYGGNTALFLTAVDPRVRAGAASGALASFERKMSDGTGIEMAEVIPNFTSHFDMHHVVAAIAPRPFLVVSASDDKYSIDADTVLDQARHLTNRSDDLDSIEHLRVPGGHSLDSHRHDQIIDWTADALHRPHPV